MAEVLNLAGAKPGQFDLIPSDWYDVHVENIDDIMIENDDGKLPEGTPGYNVRFVVDGGKQEGKSAFNRFYLPLPDSGYDEGKTATAQGRFVDFLLACGYAEKDVGYNSVRNFKPVGQDLQEGGGIL